MHPLKIKKEFQATLLWPKDRSAGEVDLLICIEEVALHPRLLEIKGNLAVKSHYCVSQQ